MIRILAVGLCLLAAAPALANAPDEEAALSRSQAALGRTLADHRFLDTDGKSRWLSDYRGKPLLLNLVYTACTDVCPTIIQNLYPAVEVAHEALGEASFAVITVGFDSLNDTPDRMRAFARQQGIDLPGWDFLSADKGTVNALAEDVGFSFYPSAAGFDHMAQVSVLDANGRISSQVYGGIFDPPAIVEPLKDVVFGRESAFLSVEGLANRIRLFCTIYNPNTGRYQFDYSLFLGIAIGVICIVGVTMVLVREWRRTAHRRS